MTPSNLRAVAGYEGLYSVSRAGEVISHAHARFHHAGTTRNYKEKTLKQFCDRKGYCSVGLHKDGKKRFTSVHRIIAIAFIPNPKNKPMVNHKDGNPSNNQIENLEWATSQENVLHGFRVLGRVHPRGSLGKASHNSVPVLIDGVRYRSITQAWENTDYSCKYIVEHNEIGDSDE